MKKLEKTKLEIFIFVLVFSISAIIFIFWPRLTQSPVNEDVIRVINVVDGDTINVLIQGKKEAVRLIGIDTPEKESPYTREECFGREASMKTKELLFDKNIQLQKDSLSEDRDKYNRLLRYIWLKEENINAHLVKQGFARVYPYFSFEQKEEFVRLEEEAREQNLGLWGECE